MGRMKEYKVVNLNPKVKWSTKKDLMQVEEVIASVVADGWTLENVVPYVFFGGYVVGIFSKEK